MIKVAKAVVLITCLDPDCPGGPCAVDETVRMCCPLTSVLLGPVEAVV